MHEIFLIARREYLERLRSKAFRVSTVLIPLAFAGVFSIADYSSRMGSGTRHVVVASDDVLLAENTRAELIAPEDAETARGQVQGLVVDVAPASAAELSGLKERVETKAIDGYLWLRGGAQGGLEATYVSAGSADLVGKSKMEDAVSHAVMRESLVERGATAGEIAVLREPVLFKTLQIKNGQMGPADAGKHFMGAYGMAMVLLFAVTFYGMDVARSVVGEKTSRIFEVLLSTVKPESLMAGKLLGVGAAAMTQIGIWIVALLVLSASSLGAAQMGPGGLAQYGVTGVRLILLVVYFMLGFFFYASLSAGFGAAVSQESEIQQFAFLLVLPQTVNLLLITYILGSPGAWQVVLLSLFPPCTPVVMMMRMSAMAVPAWQIGLSLVLMVGAICGVLWVASRIYRVGILMYGKRAVLPEMLRWLRYS